MPSFRLTARNISRPSKRFPASVLDDLETFRSRLAELHNLQRTISSNKTASFPFSRTTTHVAKIQGMWTGPWSRRISTFVGLHPYAVPLLSCTNFGAESIDWEDFLSLQSL